PLSMGRRGHCRTYANRAGDHSCLAVESGRHPGNPRRGGGPRPPSTDRRRVKLDFCPAAVHALTAPLQWPAVTINSSTRQRTATMAIDHSPEAYRPNRRQVFGVLAGLGVGSLVFQRALAAQVQPGASVTPEMIQQAEWIAGLKLSENDRKALATSLSN